MISKTLGLYVHIPFCRQKCHYCDFCSFADTTPELRAAYVKRLCDEIRTAAARAGEYTVDTVYIGGGTPTVLDDEQLLAIGKVIRENYRLSSDVEFTVEANPKTVTPDKIRALREIGANRLSLGLQSIHEKEQKILGRIHNYEDFLESYRMAREGGFDNISVDLMYAIPHQTPDSFRASIDAVIALRPEHISAYSLILEEGTPFFRMQQSLDLPDEDTELLMHRLLCERMRESGYEHYEISNFARDGRYSRHNLRYWSLSPYLGFGLGAHSYFEGERYFVPTDMDAYLHTDSAYYECERTKDLSEDAYEYAMLRLRLSDGISLSDYRARFGADFLHGREDAVSRFIESGLMLRADDRLALSEEGMLVSLFLLGELL